MYKYFELLKAQAGSEESYRIVLRHSLEVLAKSIEIINRKGLQDEVDFELIIAGSILHDIGAIGFVESKLKEKENALEVGGKDFSIYICHGTIGAEILRKEGLEREARIAERHTGAGLTKEEIAANGWPLPQQDFLPETLEEKLICYADKFSSKSPDKKDTLESVEKEFEGYGQGPHGRFLALKEMFE
jgi:uncharacterized protein